MDLWNGFYVFIVICNYFISKIHCRLHINASKELNLPIYKDQSSLPVFRSKRDSLSDQLLFSAPPESTVSQSSFLKDLS